MCNDVFMFIICILAALEKDYEEIGIETTEGEGEEEG